MPSKIFFTADLHLGHKNAIKYCNRPFKTVEEMNEVLIKNWNKIVSDKDNIYVVGDFALMGPKKTEEVLKNLKGRKFLIRDNHDKSLKESMALKYFEWIKDYYLLKVQDSGAIQKIVLFHYALRTWDSAHSGSWSLYGHSHGNLKDDSTSLSLDVGVDCHNFRPISYEEVKEIMPKKNWKPTNQPEIIS
ncbi:MAG: phosphoesterase [Omnitrophica bacterium RIFCSPLOWO2_12_FULL_44_17]|uniref:Phosphoesterase n=1 Tax=Candidatus Danuiimicrobium aquiferis TaxID=1801832 RepID=A0A1G1L0X4_9BACT|nr:MAG: phosphoesterase [Omnitrophica bacterium RIFCSPHIGHO2_02_FULL_45_28]OGW90593.1 MAG: phosphoesterase [Omnitrophica bacterium RIFCSPHIGHO2_12_FULL_44_12]OGW98788.1 MAG: phosphoesterase [Omnitrophica bacterium RIFCSPLOWO2_12_FULL_44_17]OGX02494.1 MAG: phosphoesterase [Omnitrophica bacterium RIFCSPLOWO2_02_FULL_44_11]